MGWLDQVPRAGKLYIGGLHALYQRPDLFKEAGITHIVSVIDFNIYEAGAFKQYERLHIRLDDHPNENLLEYFNETTKYIDDALSGGGGVFVHCAMGKSRSAAVCCAYLMKKYSLSPEQALNQVCEGRPVCSPNVGFMEQLGIYDKMNRASTAEESEEVYQTWLKDRFTGDVGHWERRLSKL